MIHEQRELLSHKFTMKCVLMLKLDYLEHCIDVDLKNVLLARLNVIKLKVKMVMDVEGNNQLLIV